MFITKQLLHTAYVTMSIISTKRKTFEMIINHLTNLIIFTRKYQKT